MTTMYCVKCRSKKDVENASKETAKNGKPMLRAKCPDCNTGMTKFVAA